MRKFLCWAVIFVLLASGCGGQKPDNGAAVTDETKYGDTYPIDTDKTLTYWISNSVHSDYKSYKDQPSYQALIKATGVNVDFIGPPLGQARDNFNIIIALGNISKESRNMLFSGFDKEEMPSVEDIGAGYALINGAELIPLQIPKVNNFDKLWDNVKSALNR